MLRLFGFVYGLAAYLVFLAVFLWFVAFVGDFAVAKTVNTGPARDPAGAVLIDLFLVALFGIPHTVMARSGFKRSLVRLIPAQIERSTYIWVSNAMLGLLMWQWQPITVAVWQAEGVLRTALWAVFALGWALLLVSTFLTDHFQLFGLRQITAYLRNREGKPGQFRAILFYKLVRHPMMLGFLIALWSPPTMTVGGLLLAGGMSVYILIGLYFEERALEEELGEKYRAYKQSTPMLVPGLGGVPGAGKPAR